MQGSADRLTRAWSTTIVALKDNYDRPGQLAFYIDEHSTGTYFDSYEACRPWTQDSSYDFIETPPRVAGIR